MATRLLISLLAFIGLFFVSISVLAEEKVICVEFNGIEYCESTTVIKVGEREVPIDDPFALLNATKSSQAEKIALWDTYHYPPVIKELARQLMITEDELIFELRDADKAWMALYELTQVYDFLIKDLNGNNVDHATIDKLFEHILDDITANIMKQLTAYDGEEV